MLVPNMTLEEIRKEIEKDYPILYRKLGYMEHDLRKRLFKKQIDDGYTKFFDYSSKLKNEWICRIHFHKKETYNALLLYFFDGKGVCGIALTENWVLVYHTGHFFKRYNERRNLNLVHMKDIIRVYMDENIVYTFSLYKEVSPGVFLIFGKIDSGTIFGTLYEKSKFVKVNTFLPNDMLNDRQKALLSKLDNIEVVDINEIGSLVRDILNKENQAEPETFS